LLTEGLLTSRLLNLLLREWAPGDSYVSMELLSGIRYMTI